MLLAAAVLLLGIGAPDPTLVLPEHREELQVVAQPERDVDKARQLFDAGVKAAAAARWDVAIRFFAESYRHAGRPGALYALGRAHRALYFDAGRDPVQLRLALLRFRQFVERDTTSQNLQRARGYIAELEPYAKVLEGFADDVVITRLLVHSPVDGATISVDSGPALPVPISLDIDPGAHHVEVRAEGFASAGRDVDVPRGSTVAIEVPLEPLPATLRVTGPRRATVHLDGREAGPTPATLTTDAGLHQVAVTRPGREVYIRELQLRRGKTRVLDATLRTTAQRKLSFAALGLGAGSLVAAATLTGLALRAQAQASTIARERLSTGVSSDRFARGQRLWQQRDGLRTAAITTGVIGGVLVVTGLILYFTDRPRLADRLFEPEPRR